MLDLSAPTIYNGTRALESRSDKTTPVYDQMVVIRRAYDSALKNFKLRRNIT